MFPVDLPDVEDLTSASEQYLSALQAEPLMDKYFCSSLTSKVLITPSNVTRLQLFDDDQPPCCVLALHPPDDPTEGLPQRGVRSPLSWFYQISNLWRFPVLALYLRDTWWALDDVLRTSSKSRRGLVLVRSTTERLIVFLLSQVVDSLPPGGALFSRHPRTESLKIMWSDGEAVGFYSFKHKGYLCSGWSLSYVLPVLDSLQVRCRCRRRGFGFHMLDDFCSSFSTEDFLGISSPVSPNMAAVLLRFLGRSVAERDRLYEVEPPGDWTQRRNIWLGFQLGRYALGPVDEGSVTSLELQMDPALGSTQEIRPRPNRSCRKSGPGSGSAAHAGHSDSKARRSEDPQERRRRAGRPRRPRRT